jgi:hypothetical protein
MPKLVGSGKEKAENSIIPKVNEEKACIAKFFYCTF